MNQTKMIIPTGIQRNSPQGTTVAASDEIINMRYQNSAWEPVGQKDTALGPNGEEFPNPNYSIIVAHRMDSQTNWIGHNPVTDKGHIYWYNPATLEVLQTLALNGTENVLDIRFMKRFLLVITDQTVYRFLFRDNVYTGVKLTGIEPNFTVQLNYTGVAALNIMTEEATTAEGLLGKYYKLLSEQSELNRHFGGMFYRYVITLYDGTQIQHSVPNYFQIGSFGAYLIRNGANFKLKFDKFITIGAKVTFTNLLDPDAYANFKDIISSIDLYASRIIQPLDISETTITDAALANWLPGNGTTELNSKLVISDAFQEDMYDAANWYKIGTMAFAGLKQQSAPFDYQYTGDAEMDLKGYYENYATRPMILVDNYSHQSLTGEASYMYNGRLHLGNTFQTLEKPWNLAMGITPATVAILDHPDVMDPATTLNYILDTPNYYESKVVIKLNTTDGVKYVSIIGTLPAYKDVFTGARKAVFLPSLIGYPDNRAAEVAIHIKVGGVYYEILRKPMQKSVFNNFAYVVYSNFSSKVISDWVENPAGRRVDANFICYPVQFQLANLKPSVIPVDNVNLKDLNRVQPSETDNPFVFPVENSQQVGNGTILAFGTNTEDVSVGQRGQYPLYVFSTDGIWGLSIGISGVYITNVTPLSGEAIRDRNDKLDLSSGVLFITSEGLKIISGNQVQPISKALDGMPDTALLDSPFMQMVINHPKLVQLNGIADGVAFKTYLQDAILGFNKDADRAEIIVANPDYGYYYIYDTLSGFWAKVGGKLTTLINVYPALYAVNDGLGKVVNISNEIDGPVQCLLLTRALPLDMGETRKKLRRTFVRCQLTTTANKFAAAYVLSTDNLQLWKYSIGNDRNTGQFKDIWISHSAESARFYAYLFIGELDVAPLTKPNQIHSIETTVDPKLSGKLR